MYSSWSFAHPQSGHPHRAFRIALRSPVRLFLPFESWQLMWTLRSFNISRSGALIGLEVKDDASAQCAADLEALIQAEPQARLQIEHDKQHLFAPVVWGRLTRSARQSWGLELAFHFTDSDSDLLALLEELEAGAHQSASPSH